MLPQMRKNNDTAEATAKKFNRKRTGPRMNKRKRKMKKINMLNITMNIFRMIENIIRIIVNIIRIVVCRMRCFLCGVSFLVSCVFTGIVSISPLSFF